VWVTERYIADAGPPNVLKPLTGGGYFRSDLIFTYCIFTTYDARNITSTMQIAKVARQIKRDMILNRVKLTQGVTHRGRRLITDLIEYVVIDVHADLE